MSRFSCEISQASAASEVVASPPAADVIFKQSVAAALVLCLGLMLASCSSFAGLVADHWPHWAGGMPDNIPPRPGAPGYDEFIAHGQPSQDADFATGDTKPAGQREVCHYRPEVCRYRSKAGRHGREDRRAGGAFRRSPAQ